jgi:hypothetical protein
LRNELTLPRRFFAQHAPFLPADRVALGQQQQWNVMAAILGKAQRLKSLFANACS